MDFEPPQQPVFYFTRVLPAYRIPIIERLNDRLGGQLIVCHGQPPKGNPVLMQETETGFRNEMLRNYWFRDTTLHLQPFSRVFKKHGPPYVVLAEESPRTITLPLLLNRAAKAGAGRVLWGFFYSSKRAFSSRHPLQRYRIALARRVEACACYSRQSRDYMQPYVDPEKLFVAQNTMDMDTLFALRRKLEEEGKASVRSRLGIPLEHPVFVFVGSLIRSKGTDTLLEVFGRYRDRTPSTLLVIGGGPDRAFMEDYVAAHQIPDVRFLGSMPALEASAPYLYASDLMLLPGYVGLVVNHAFALGLPLITQHAPSGIPFHSPEVESIVDGKNGVFVERGNPDAMVQAIDRVLDQRDAYAREAIDYAEQHLTVDRMVDQLVQAVHYAGARRKGTRREGAR